MWRIRVSMLVSWVIFPLVLTAVSLGCGLLVRSVSGFDFPGTLLLPVGFSTIVVAVLFATSTGATAEIATPLVVVSRQLGHANPNITLPVYARADHAATARAALEASYATITGTDR